MAYQALFTGTDGTDLSAYTSDSGHTHTKQSGSGALTIQSNELRGAAGSVGAFYTASYTPPSADYKLTIIFNIQEMFSNLIRAGLRAETDGDGIFVDANGFTDLWVLHKNVGGSDTQIDTVAMTQGVHTIEIEVTGNNVQWWLDTVDQGTHSLGGDLSAAGLVAFEHFNGVDTPVSEQMRIASAEVTESGGTVYDDAGTTTGIAAHSAVEVYPQNLRPSADSADGNWTTDTGGTALAAAIDEAILSDSDFIRSEVNPANSACRVKIASGVDPQSSADHIIRWRAGKDETSGDTINVTVELRQGGGNTLGGGTLIATFSHNNVDALTTYEETLSGAEADAITNYGDLYLEFKANTA